MTRLSDLFPALPETGKQLVGTSWEDMALIYIRESEAHPGYFDVSLSKDGVINEFKKPVAGSDIGREIIGSFIGDVAPDSAFKWRTEAVVKSEPVVEAEQVYFISDEQGYIKIGVARNVDSRLKSLQTASRQELTLVGAVEGSYKDERRYHQMFADLRVRGEWFRPDVRLTNFIKGLFK